MLYTNFHGNSVFDSREEDFVKVYTIYGHVGHIGHVACSI